MIDKLYDSFTAEIRQTVMNNRIKVTCLKEKFIKIITHYNTKILKKENSEATNKILKIIIKNIFMQIKKERSDNLIIILFWSKTDSSILDINQYQKITLIKMNNKIIALSKKINNNDNHVKAKKSSLSLLDIKKKVSCTFF